MYQMNETKQAGLNIKAVAERTGVPLHTLRAWERRYGVPRPNRHLENCYRLYDEQDIADVVWMKRQVEAGVSPAQASAQVRQQAGGALRLTVSSTEPLAALQTALYDAFLARDETTAQKLLNEAWSAFSPEQIVLDVLQPTMRQIGDGWQRNLLSVEQEHFASNLVRQRLHALLQAQPVPLLTAPRLVAACAPEEQHDLGLLIFTLLARRQGWNVNYLGQRTPLAELDRAAQSARFIVLSISTVTGLASLVPLWNQTLPPAPILFGGEMFQQLPSLREHLPGAYLGQDSVQALQNLATRTPRVSTWKPSRRKLNAALGLDNFRLQIASETARRFMESAARMKTTARNELQHGMTHAALFLTDAFVSALAFDAPELINLQGAWANEFMPAHQIPLASLHHFLKLYNTIATQSLPTESAKLVNALALRLAASVEPTLTEPRRSSI